MTKKKKVGRPKKKHCKITRSVRIYDKDYNLIVKKFGSLTNLIDEFLITYKETINK